MSNINERFKEIRIKLGYSQKEYAKEIGISQSHMSGIENNKYNLSTSLIKLICIKFGINEEWFRDGIGDIFVINKDFDTISKDEILKKYEVMKSMLEQFLYNQNENDIINIVEAYSYFTSLITMNIGKDNKTKYLEYFKNFIDNTEKLTFETYGLKNFNGSNYKTILNYKDNSNDKIKKSIENLKAMQNIFLEQYKIDTKL